MPALKFEQFRAQVESLVGARFLTVTTNSQNLLPQKQSIEQETQSIEADLATYAASRKSLLANHASAVASIQALIDAKSGDIAALNKQLLNENATYNARLAALDQQIAYTQKSLTAVKTQDQNLLDEVSTVNGTISLNWISLWDMIQLYVSGPMIALIFAILSFISYWRPRPLERFLP